MSEFRSGLRSWVDRVKRGEDVVVTERGVPVARLVAVDSATVLERLERDGVLTSTAAPRPRATGRRRAHATGSVSELVAELRR